MVLSSGECQEVTICDYVINCRIHILLKKFIYIWKRVFYFMILGLDM